MRFKTTQRLLIAVCILAAIIWLTERDGRQNPAGSELPPVNLDEISQIIIESGQFRVACTNVAGSWFLERPVRAYANPDAMMRILSAIKAIKVEDVVSIQQRWERDLTLETYGLAPPRARILFQDPLGWKEWQIGTNVPLGDLVYAKLAASSDVVATDRELFEAIPPAIEGMRDRIVLHGEASRTTRLEIKCAGAPFMQLTRVDGEWWIKQPVEARADAGKVLDILDKVYALQADKFIWDPGSAADAPRPNLGDEPSARITTWMLGDRVGKELILDGPVSDDAEHIYAKRRDFESIYAVDRSVLESVTVAVNSLRARDLFVSHPREVKLVRLWEGDRRLTLEHSGELGWMITEPVKSKADEQMVDDMVGRIVGLKTLVFLEGAKADLESLGLEPPAYRIEIGHAAIGDSAGGETATPASQEGLHLGHLPVGEDRTIFARYPGQETLLRINLVDIDWLLSRMTDPLVYRDRTVLAIPSAHIQNLSLQTEAGLQSVARSQDGQWESPADASAKVSLSTVEDVLFLLSHLRARRIDVEAPKNLGRYGLEKPGATLTLGLTEEEGIKKTLLFGDVDEDRQGRYAMVQGVDIVFSLDKQQADRLTRPLVIASDGAAPGGP